ncbi:response regulator [Phormidium sp. CCY1219]|uniref:response regulator n=1 Tax=Phormidium sp. CCY1219 TaxID=2886104 RepID=UPI002D1F0280|nr:response regulator [Phormidium sp. CCY1219]MEB3828126.1 response regulator [Phormidium sp. CCY1219]
MENAIPELDNIRSQLKSLERRRKKPKMLVVDDEPDNLDLLYRTFRREFQVLKADSGVSALEILSEEGEVAVIISDQRMPEMKGTEFLSKTVPQFPNTVRIILTGFTDIEDLVEAINSGQVYKYITKPWDPHELKQVVQRAAETYELLKQRTEELRRAEAQTNLLMTIVGVVQESDSLEGCLEPIAKAFGENFSADICILQLMEGGSLAAGEGIYTVEGTAENWLAEDPLTLEAIASDTVQISVNVAKDDNLSEVPHYQNSGIQAHLAIPVLFRNEKIALLSLQWKQPCTLREDQLQMLHLSVQQVAIALTCTRYHP